MAILPSYVKDAIRRSFYRTIKQAVRFFGCIFERMRANEFVADWIIANMLAARYSPDGSGHSALRFVMKAAIHYTPLFGNYTVIFSAISL